MLLDGSVSERNYLTTVGLAKATTYKFKVTARNSVGSSVFSEVLEVLAARKPDPPVSVLNVASITNAN